MVYGKRSVAPLILHVGTIFRSVEKSTTRLLYPPRGDRSTHSAEGFVGSRNGLNVLKKINSLGYSGIQVPDIQGTAKE
jgi:hypothetical protein